MEALTGWGAVLTESGPLETAEVHMLALCERDEPTSLAGSCPAQFQITSRNGQFFERLACARLLQVWLCPLSKSVRLFVLYCFCR